MEQDPSVNSTARVLQGQGSGVLVIFSVVLTTPCR